MNKRKITIQLKGHSAKPLVFQDPAQVAIEPNIRLLTIITTQGRDKKTTYNYNLDSIVQFVDESEESMISLAEALPRQ